MKRLSKTKFYYLLQTTVLTMLLIVLEWGFFKLFPQFLFSTYPLIPIFFFFVGVIMINAFEAIRSQDNVKGLVSFFAVRGIRIIVSLIVMLIYAVVARYEARNFMLCFAANYCIFLIYDCWFFTAFDLGHAKKQK